MSYIIELDIIVSSGYIDDISLVVGKDVATIVESYIEPELTEQVVRSRISDCCGVNNEEHVLDYLRLPLSPALQVFEKHFDRYITRLRAGGLLSDEQYFEESGSTYKRFGPKLMKRVKAWYDHGPLFFPIEDDEKYSGLVRALTKAAQLVMHPESANGNLFESFMASRPFDANFLQIMNSETKMARTLEQGRDLFNQMSTRPVQPSILNRGYSFGNRFLDAYYQACESILLNT